MRQAEISFHSVTNDATTNSSRLPACLALYDTDWKIGLTGLQTEPLDIVRMDCEGSWRQSEVAVESLDARINGNPVSAQGWLDFLTGRVEAEVSSKLDLESLKPFLAPKIKEQLAHFQCQQPPAIDVSVVLTLPTVLSQTNWLESVLPSLDAVAAIQLGSCSWQGVAADSLKTTLAYTNGAVRVDHLEVHRPDGTVSASGWARPDVGDYAFTVDSLLEPTALIKQLADLGESQVWLDQSQLAHPPKIHAQGQGNWHDAASLGVQGSIELTNFVALGQPIASLTSALDYSNLVLKANDLRIIQGDQFVTLATLKFDFAHNIMSFDKGVATFDPRRVFHSLDSILPEFLRQIGFDTAPACDATDGSAWTIPKRWNSSFTSMETNFAGPTPSTCAWTT